MGRMITSKNMGSVTELTVIADIRDELVEVRPTLTHATRLRALLRILFEIRRVALEESEGPTPAGPLERLGFLHFVRFSIFDNERKFMLAVTFDGAWEPYIRAIAEQAGPLLDVIFCHTQDYNAHSTDKGYWKFAEWVRAHQQETDFFFADQPGTSTQDVRYLDDLQAASLDAADLDVDAFTLDHVNETDVSKPEVSRALRALRALHQLSELFSDEAENQFLLRTTEMILSGTDVPHEMELLRQKGLHLPYQQAASWYGRLVAVERPKAAPVSVPDEPANVQGNVLDAYHGMTHGCLVLLQITDADRARMLLPLQVSPTQNGEALEHDGEEGWVATNVALTLEGLRRLGVPDDQLSLLPQEFREGMEARAGWLGDLGINHPSHWKRPRAIRLPEETTSSGPEAGDEGEVIYDDLEVALSSVDVVVQLQVRADREALRKRGVADHLFSTEHPLYAAVRQLQAKLEGGLRILSVEAQRRPDPRPIGKKGALVQTEHFGFKDGLSQPSTDKHAIARDRVSLGEILLGYPDDRDGTATPPTPEFFRDGTFQVVRKLRQNVPAFEKVVDAHDKHLPERMMGRRFDGTSRLNPDKSDSNDFDYEKKSASRIVPTDAHIRRTNPRNGPLIEDRPWNPTHRAVPRIVRRGFSYGPSFVSEKGTGKKAKKAKAQEEAERGLFFMAFNRSIADQFEVVQRWISGGNSTGISSRQSDPLMGLPEPGRDRTMKYRNSDGEIETVNLGSEPFVTLDWGLYLFVPSIESFRRIRELGPARRQGVSTPAEIDEGREVIRQMRGLYALHRVTNPAAAESILHEHWKKLIEDRSTRDTMRKVWAAIRADGGTLDTPYGVLVGKADQILEIFQNSDDYSVSGYWDRMRDSLGELFLGMDPNPQPMAASADPEPTRRQARYVAAVDRERYAREAGMANPFIYGVKEPAAFALAEAVSEQVLDLYIRASILGAAGQPSPSGPKTLVVEIRRFVYDVLAGMSQRLFGLPDGEHMKRGGPFPAKAHCPDNYGATARYIFSPNPTAFVEAEGRVKGRELLESARAYVRGRAGADVQPGSLMASLYTAHGLGDADQPSDAQAEEFAKLVAGVIHGFVGPVGGTSISLLNEWVQNGEFWRQQARVYEAFGRVGSLAPRWEEVHALLTPDVATGMRIQPFPYLLHRTPVRDVKIRQTPEEGDAFDLPIRAGRRVVLGLVSAAHDETPVGLDETDILFGGRYRKERQMETHACPGQDIAFGSILGIFTSLSRKANVRHLGGLNLELAPYLHDQSE